MKGRLLTSVILLLAIASIGFASGTSEEGAKIESLRIGLNVDEGTLNPYTYTSGNGLHVVHMVYDCLFQLNAENQPVPWLVKDFQVSDDQTVYTLNLYENVTFHDGEALTAEDVKFTYEYIMKYPKSRFTRPSKAITGIETKGDYTVEFTIASPKYNFLITPFTDVPILPKHIWENITNPDESSETIGSGPYQLTEVKTGELYRFEANPNYFKGAVKVDKLVMPIIKDRNAMFTALRADELDMAAVELPPELIPDFDNDSRLKVAKGAGLTSNILQINCENEHLGKTKFRQALAYATDQEAIVSVIMLGAATPASMGYLHPSMPSYNPEVKAYPQDLDKANALLDELGYKDTNGDGKRETASGDALEFELLVYSNNPIRIRITELLRDWYAEIGITISVKSMDMDTVDSLVWPGFDVAQGRDYELSMWGWSSSILTFPDRLVDLFHSQHELGMVNLGAFNSEELDKLGEKLQSTYDDAGRQEILDAIQLIASEELPIIPFYYPDLNYAYNPAAYDEWVFMLGTGILNKHSFIEM